MTDPHIPDEVVEAAALKILTSQGYMITGTSILEAAKTHPRVFAAVATARAAITAARQRLLKRPANGRGPYHTPDKFLKAKDNER